MKTITLTPDASGMVDWPTLSNDKKSVVTIGSFDGMHQGHQAVIRRVAELAEQEQAFSVVVLFDPRWCTLTPPNMTVRNRPQARLTRRR